MGVGAGLYMYVVVVQKFTFAISSPGEFLYLYQLAARQTCVACKGAVHATRACARIRARRRACPLLSNWLQTTTTFTSARIHRAATAICFSAGCFCRQPCRLRLINRDRPVINQPVVKKTETGNTADVNIRELSHVTVVTIVQPTPDPRSANPGCGW